MRAVASAVMGALGACQNRLYSVQAGSSPDEWCLCLTVLNKRYKFKPRKNRVEDKGLIIEIIENRASFSFGPELLWHACTWVSGGPCAA
jgi:hypothetical protein